MAPRKPPKTPIEQFQSTRQNFVNNWNQRVAQVKAAGYDPQPLQSIVDQDWQRVARGGQAMQEAEAQAIISTVLQGKPTIKPKSRPGGITGFLSNALSDVKDLATGYVKAPIIAFNEADDLRKAIMKGELPKEDKLEHVGSITSPSGWAKALRNETRIPVLRDLPLVNTLAGLTTEEGRKHLLQHPLATGLDVLPVAVGGAEALGASLPEAGTVSGEALRGSPIKAAATATSKAVGYSPESGTVGEALSKGQLGKALWRAAPNAITDKIATANPLPHIPTLGEKLGFGAGSSRLARGETEASQLVSDQLTNWFNRHGLDTKLIDKLSLGDRRIIYDRATTLEKDPVFSGPVTPERMQFLRDLADEALKRGLAKGDLWQYRYGEHTLTYSHDGTEGDLFKTLKRRNELAEEVPRAAAKVEQAKSKSNSELLKAQADLVRAQKKARQAEKVFNWKLKRTPEAKFMPLVEERWKGLAKAEAQKKFAGDVHQLQLVMSEIEQGSFRSLDKDTVLKLRTQALKDWTPFLKTHDPIWIPKVATSAKESSRYPHISPVRIPQPDASKARSLDLTPHLHDAAIAFTHAAMQDFMETGSEHYHMDHVMPYALSPEDATALYEAKLKNESVSPIEDARGKAEAEMRKQWVSYDPHSWVPTSTRIGAMPKESLMIPKWVAKDLQRMMPDNKIPLVMTVDKVTGLFKVSVFTSPRHLAHIVLGGANFMATREGIKPFLEVGNAYRKLKEFREDPEKWWRGMNRHQDLLTNADLYGVAEGKTLGRLLKTLKSPVDWMQKFEEWALNMQRAMVFLSGEKKALRRGMTEEEARMAGVELANKVLVDVNGLTPIERSIARRVMPFYAFTKHLYKYVLSMPADHPIRMSILTNLAEMEVKDWQSGLPQTMMNLFALGDPDSNGNLKAIDVRSTNPFRSLAMTTSLDGLMSTLNPIITAPFAARGWNVLTNSPELFPDTQINPQTGKLEAKPPSNAGIRFMSAFIPQVQTLDDLIGISDQARRMQQTDPQNLKRFMLNNMGLGPFQPPTSFNIPTEMAKAEKVRYQQAQKDVSKAVQSGDTSTIKGYQTVPFQSQLTTPSAIGNILSSVSGQAQQLGVSPKLLIPAPRTPTSRLRKPRKPRKPRIGGHRTTVHKARVPKPKLGRSTRTRRRKSI